MNEWMNRKSTDLCNMLMFVSYHNLLIGMIYPHPFLFVSLFFLVLLFWLRLQALSWKRMNRVDTPVLFLMLEEMFVLFPFSTGVFMLFYDVEVLLLLVSLGLYWKMLNFLLRILVSLYIREVDLVFCFYILIWFCCFVNQDNTGFVEWVR